MYMVLALLIYNIPLIMQTKHACYGIINADGQITFILCLFCLVSKLQKDWNKSICMEGTKCYHTIYL